MRLHARAPPGTRLEKTEQIFAEIEDEIRQVIPPQRNRKHHRQHRHSQRRLQPRLRRQPDARRQRRRHPDFAQAGEHGSTAEYTDRLRKRLNQKFPDVVFFFEAANITNQILNFGLPAPIDVQVLGAQRRRRITRSRGRSPPRSRRSRARPTSTFTRWWTTRRSISTWTAARPGRSA